MRNADLWTLWTVSQAQTAGWLTGWVATREQGADVHPSLSSRPNSTTTLASTEYHAPYSPLNQGRCFAISMTLTRYQKSFTAHVRCFDRKQCELGDSGEKGNGNSENGVRRRRQLPANAMSTKNLCPNANKWAVSIIQLDNGKYSESLEKAIARVNCLSCNLCVGVNLSREWLPLEEALKIKDDVMKNGWVEVFSETDTKIHYILSQILYRELETPNSDQLEALFDMPDPKDLMKILWIDGAAVGFYTMKLKGALVEEAMDCYKMHTLDTAYIRIKHRRLGLGIGILADLVETFPNEDIGFSTPVSKPMLRVMKKFLTENTNYRNRFWELTGTGGEGNQKILWYTFNRSQE